MNQQMNKRGEMDEFQILRLPLPRMVQSHLADTGTIFGPQGSDGETPPPGVPRPPSTHGAGCRVFVLMSPGLGSYPCTLNIKVSIFGCNSLIFENPPKRF